jgi:hypothetical protein
VLAEKSFLGQRLDLEHYAGLPLNDFEIEVVDSNEDPFDFTGYSNFKFALYAKAHGKLLEEFDIADPTDSIITLSGINSTSFLELRPALYFFEVYADTGDSPAQKFIINYGIFDTKR